MSVEQDSVGDGLHRFDEVESPGSGANEGVEDAVALGKDEKAGGRGVIETDAESDETFAGELFVYRDQFGKFLGGGGTPGCP